MRDCRVRSASQELNGVLDRALGDQPQGASLPLCLDPALQPGDPLLGDNDLPLLIECLTVERTALQLSVRGREPLARDPLLLEQA